MTRHTSERRGHIVDLLPAYVNGTLGRAASASVRAHLAHCQSCRDDLAEWQTLGAVAQAATELVSAPDASVLAAVWAHIDAPAPAAMPVWHVALRRAAMLWQLLLGQVSLLPRGIWIISAVVVVAGCTSVLLVNSGADFASFSLLGLVVPLVAAAGVAFTYGPEHDPGLEVALATPTSARLVLLSRAVLVFGYNYCLALGVTFTLAALRGFSFSLLASLWVGPTLLVGALSLLLTVTLSTTAALTGLAAIWCLRFVEAASSAVQHLLGGDSYSGFIWQTNPAMLALALALLFAAIAYVPRQRRLA